MTFLDDEKINPPVETPEPEPKSIQVSQYRMRVRKPKKKPISNEEYLLRMEELDNQSRNRRGENPVSRARKQADRYKEIKKRNQRKRKHVMNKSRKIVSVTCLVRDIQS